MASVQDEIRAVLEKTKVKDLSRPSSIFEFSAEASLPESFQLLCDKKVLSAPVYVPDTKKYIGFLDCRDLVNFVGAADKAKHSSLQDLVAAAGPVTMTSLAKKHPFVSVDGEATLYDVAKLLRAHYRRVPYLENGVIVNIISQSVLIKHLTQNLKDLPSLKTISVKDSGIGSSPVIKAQSSLPTRNAFQILGEKGRFGMAILGEGDSLITQSSAQDLKLWLKMPSSELLDLPILKFLQVIRSQDIDIQVPALNCSDKDSIGFVIQKLEVTRQHRIYVADQAFHPIKVVSLTDILRWCVPE